VIVIALFAGILFLPVALAVAGVAATKLFEWMERS